VRAPVLFRIAAVLFALFALAHTAGFLGFRPRTPEGLAVWHAMETVPIAGTRTYRSFYVGFGLFISAAMLLAAAFCWWLGGLAKTSPRETLAPAIMLALFQAAGLAITFAYFGAPQIAFAAAILLTLVLAGRGAAGGGQR
jgi:hypothetical protein